ncbi:MAG TPA: thioredoxin domain-containing protein [Burkholderiaceae bacterium]
MDEFSVVPESDFAKSVLDSTAPVVVDFFSKTCGPCKLLEAALKDVAPDYDGEIKVVKVDVEESPAVARQYSIQSVPTMLLFRKGRLTQRVLGNQTRSKLAELFDAHVAE